MESKKGFFANFKYDFPSSIVVFLVALPLCLGIAMASEAPLFSGLIAGIVGGIVVSLISGSSLGVSGPAAGLATIVAQSISDLGTFELFLSAVVLAGVFQIVLGVIKAGVIGYYFPNAVIRGMLSGIGITIILKQIPHLVGYDKDPEGSLKFATPDGHNSFSELFYMFEQITPGAVLISVLSMAVLLLWGLPFIQKTKVAKIIQAPLLVVVMGILLSMAFEGHEVWALQPEQLVRIPVADSFDGFIDMLSMPDFSRIFDPQVIQIAGIIALVASLESLLSLEATDKLDPQKRVSPANRELIAQGIGNTISGLIGGLPVTQVIVRSSANIQSGGKTKASAFIHGILLLIAVISIPKLLNWLPMSALAAVLLVVGYKLAKPSLFAAMYRRGMTELVPYVVTIAGIVFADLLVGIGLGLVIGIIVLLWKNYKRAYHLEKVSLDGEEWFQMQFAEEVSFLNKASISHTLRELAPNSKIILDGTKSVYFHADIKEILEDFCENAETERNIQVKFVGLERDFKAGTIELLKPEDKSLQGT